MNTYNVQVEYPDGTGKEYTIEAADTSDAFFKAYNREPKDAYITLQKKKEDNNE